MASFPFSNDTVIIELNAKTCVINSHKCVYLKLIDIRFVCLKIVKMPTDFFTINRPELKSINK